MEGGLSRRDVLGAAAAAAGLALGGRGLASAGKSRRSGQGFVANNLELVTVTPSSIELYWLTSAPTGTDSDGLPIGVDTNTEVLLAPADSISPLKTAYLDDTRRHWHHAVVTGLEPGRTYRFEARSDGVRATGSLMTTRVPGSPERSGMVTTLTLPEGKYLRSVAIMNDVHVGEHKQGIIVGEVLPYVEQAPGLPPYAQMMLTDGLAEIDRRFAHPPVVVDGDVTNIGAPDECQAALSALAGYGAQGTDWWVTRGNHDRALKNAHGGHDDWFGQHFNLPWQQLWTHTDSGLRFIGLDTTRFQMSGGVIHDDQFAALDKELRHDRDIPTMVFGHHPVTVDASLTTPSGPFFTLGPLSGKRLQQMEGDAPGIFLHHAGHTHRNRVDTPDFGQNIEYLETGSGSPYPGGYTMVHLFTGGYLVNFHRTSTDRALEWLARSRFSTFGVLSEATLGTLEDRNHVVARDLSGVAGDGSPVPPALRV